jgi:uncharacterized protein YggE
MWQQARVPFLTILFIFLGFVVYTKFFGPIPFTVNSITTTKSTLFTVSGTGDATAIPDTALLSLGVNKTASTVDAAQKQVNTIINQVTENIKRLGVDAKDIKTVNYSVNPNYDYTAGSQKINGYVVDATIEVKVTPIDKANQAIDAATAAGATSVGNIQFTLADDKKKALEEQARKEAIDAAKAKAESISRTAGIRLGRIVDVQENNSGYPQPVMMAAGLDKAVAPENPTTQLNPGENKITSNVTISYETL